MLRSRPFSSAPNGIILTRAENGFRVRFSKSDKDQLDLHRESRSDRGVFVVPVIVQYMDATAIVGEVTSAGVN